jgi:hypothetical protein
MREMVYFDSEKRAFGKEYEEIEIIASIDADTWFIYSNDPVGTTWDIINGSFVKFKPAEDIMREKRDAERSFERAKFYDEADKMIAKHNDFVALNQDPDGSHAAELRAWRAFKINVRGTQEQLSYPDDVIYPKMPRQSADIRDAILLR